MSFSLFLGGWVDVQDERLFLFGFMKCNEKDVVPHNSTVQCVQYSRKIRLVNSQSAAKASCY